MSTEAAQGGRETGKTRLLIVEDHALLREALRALIGLARDIEIAGEAADGGEALAKARELRPDVVIMDLKLPDMDGLEATRRLKKESPQARVLVLTQYNERDYVLAAVRSGALGYVPKNASSTDLLAAIRAVSRGETYLHPSVATVLIDNYRQRWSGDEKADDSLTPRMKDILQLVADGYTARQIAAELNISVKSVHSLLPKIMERLGIHSRAGLIRYAMRKGLVK